MSVRLIKQHAYDKITVTDTAKNRTLRSSLRAVKMGRIGGLNLRLRFSMLADTARVTNVRIIIRIVNFMKIYTVACLN